MNDMQLNTPQEAIEAIKQGEMVVIVDDENRENEGDLVMAAEKAKPEDIALMVRYTTGIICTPVTVQRAKQLELLPMVVDNDAPLATAFTVTVDYKKGLTTGISATERCATIRALADEKSSASDFVRPGHVFPLIARAGGVLMRSGHTEAAVDLAQLAGLSPVGVIGELVNDDGTVKKGKQIFDFARQHQMKMISIEDLIAYRQARENLVTRVLESEVDTLIGKAKTIIYRSQFSSHEHLAVIFGEVKQNMVVRLQRADMINDIFTQDNNINRVMQLIEKSGGGAIIYIRDYLLDDKERPNITYEDQNPSRDIGLGAQILRDLGLQRVSVISSQTRQYIGLQGFGIEVAETIIL